MYCEYFFLVGAYLIIFLTFFEEKILFYFDNLSYSFQTMVCAFCVLSKKSKQTHKIFYHVFFHKFYTFSFYI